MTLLEIAGGLLFNSIRSGRGWVAHDHPCRCAAAGGAGLSLHRHATDARFTFYTGKLGDLAGFTSAIMRAMTAPLIGWKALTRLLDPVPIAFSEAIPIASLGLAVNVVSARLLDGGANHPNHGHTHHHTSEQKHGPHGQPHTTADRDNNMRAAVAHVIADAAVSVLVIIGLLLTRTFGWLWIDPLAGIVGACVIVSWAYGLVRDTGQILIDTNPDRQLTDRLRKEIETDVDRLTDLHDWRLGPDHLAAVLSVATGRNRRPEDYHVRLRHFSMLSHITVAVHTP
jgi:cation diffusion facilitator family transporter